MTKQLSRYPITNIWLKRLYDSQKGKKFSDFEFMKKFPDESSAYEYFKRIFWPFGPECPFCGSQYHYVRSDPKYLCCADCRKYYTLRTNTILQKSRLPYLTWLYGLYVFVSTNGISSIQFAKRIGVTQKTAWFMLQRIRIACGNPYFIYPLNDVVEIDESLVGGLEKNKHQNKRLHGNWVDGKIPIVVVKDRKGNVHAFPVPKVNGENIHKLIKNYVSRGTSIYTDESYVYNGLSGRYRRMVVKHKLNEYVRGDVHTNGAESFNSRMNKAFYATHHFFSRKHASSYANEIAFRQNKRKNKFGILGQINYLLERAKKTRVTYNQLKQKTVQYYVYPKNTKYFFDKIRNGKQILSPARYFENPFTPDELYSSTHNSRAASSMLWKTLKK